MTPTQDPKPGADEGRLLSYLAELREDPPVGDAEITGRVRRSARWQQTARGPIQLIGHLAGALALGLAAVLGSRPKDPR